MKNYGLVGYKLSHSFSETYFTKKFSGSSIDAKYHKIELSDLDDLKEAIHKYHLDGFNVTIPYKEKIIKYLDEIDAKAKEIAAVNCVRVRNGKLSGYNTDVIGFEASLLSFLYPNHIKGKQEIEDLRIRQKSVKALVFGNGGASKAVSHVLHNLKIPYLLVSRNDLKDAIMYSDLDKSIFDEYKLLINTTPVGMYPDVENKLPLPYHYINETHYAFDLIYNPEKTVFLSFCEAEGAQIKNGYEMLVIQAEESYKIFTSEDKIIAEKK